jgi:hypothetical protein
MLLNIAIAAFMMVATATLHVGGMDSGTSRNQVAEEPIEIAIEAFAHLLDRWNRPSDVSCLTGGNMGLGRHLSRIECN